MYRFMLFLSLIFMLLLSSCIAPPQPTTETATATATEMQSRSLASKMHKVFKFSTEQGVTFANRKIAYWNNDNTLCYRDATLTQFCNESIHLYGFEAHSFSFRDDLLSWSPDENKIAYVTVSALNEIDVKSDICIYNLISSKTDLCMTPSEPDFILRKWDARGIIFQLSYGFFLWDPNMPQLSPTPVYDNLEYSDDPPVPSDLQATNGRYLTFSADNEYNVLLHEANGKVIDTFATSGCIYLSPNGLKIVYCPTIDKERIVSRNIDTGFESYAPHANWGFNYTGSFGVNTKWSWDSRYVTVYDFSTINIIDTTNNIVYSGRLDDVFYEIPDDNSLHQISWWNGFLYVRRGIEEFLYQFIP